MTFGCIILEKSRLTHEHYLEFLTPLFTPFQPDFMEHLPLQLNRFGERHNDIYDRAISNSWPAQFARL